MKVGNLVKRRNPPWGSKRGFGIILELETFKQALNPKENNKIAKVKWVGSEDPPLLYKVEDLIVVSEVK